ncbi:hypothetical protein GCM10010329_21150 [Streptomyces spiroverticillatus]|uniref:Zinc-finger domain-containing protein n=1 Tax=Streptomyces finlayi TaxID=67296 RepID=A0A918WUI1_9ACTN|nr:hypothetical protein [Streptomyces finlayi]GGZ99305.1 hypothetical protein GCM10010329_21150 [Streptomyces spiroverticillatus]GHC84052.1 hypothetical protein GCM10010334_13590 [Streptomyces finlayi]
MTSTTGTAQHPDVAEISDLTEGLLSPSRTQDVRRHVDGCALCADVQLSLEEIRGLLGTLPGPQRMPADIAGRIDAALAAEALLNSTAPGTTTDTAADVSRETSQTPARRPTVDRPAGHSRATTGPGRPASRRPRRRVVWSAVLGAAALGLGALLVQNLPTGGAGSDKQSTAKAAQSPRFAGTPLETQVGLLLDAPKYLRGDKNAPSLDAADGPPVKQPAAVPPCVQQGTGRTESPLGSKQGVYQGKQAFLLVLPHTSDPAQVEAYVVDATCVETAPTGKGELLLTSAYPRR